MRLTNKKGSAFVQALVAIGVVGVMLYFLSPEVIKHRQQVTKTASIITARLALHSMVDYTLFGIKQRWCFSKDWMPESCGTGNPPTMAQILNHPRSVERLLMKKETVDFLRLMGVGNPDAVPLSKISQVISLKSFSALHPVYRIVANLKGYKVDSINVTIERDRRGVIPEYGRELYLKVVVSLLDNAGKVIEIGSSQLTTTSFVGVYPREVGSFALLVAGDLHMDTQSAAGLKKGDAFFRQFSSREERKNYPGLIFESPVFVNGSVHLPKASEVEDDRKELDTVYTPVTFNEKIVLGEGPVKRKGTDGVAREFRPRTSGNDIDQFWAHIRQMGGFQKGVEIDGNRDLGLDYLSGITAGGSSVDPGFMEKCISYNLAKYDLFRTVNSQLRGKLLKAADNKYLYRMGLTDKNRFNPQTGQVDAPSLVSKGGWGEILKGWNLNKKDGAVARYTMNFGSMRVVGEIPDNGTVTLEPEIKLDALKNKIDGQIRSVSSDLLYENAQLQNIEKDLERLGNELSGLQQDLREQEDKRPVDKQRVNSIKDRIDNVEDRIRRSERDKNKKKTEVADLNAKLESLEKQKEAVTSKEGIQPKVHITIKSPVDPKNPDNKDVNPTFRDLEIAMENSELLVNANGDPMNISFDLEAYDVSYYRGTSIRQSWSKGNTGKLTFNNNGGNFTVSQNMTNNLGQSNGDLPDEDPFINYDIACRSQQGTAFGGTDWANSFAPNSKHSWSFTNKYEDRTNFEFNGANAYRAPGGSGTATFVVKSMARDCIIKSSANFVAGFLTCERLIIEARTKPLRIIASIVVTNGIDIAPEAYDVGIRWGTIYHPMATFELRQAGVLKAIQNQSCDTIQRYPVWHPYPSMKDVANLYRCNAISLRSKADPFRWTSVDPDCGLVSNSNSTMCKNRLVKFYVLEVSRESGI